MLILWIRFRERKDGWGERRSSVAVATIYVNSLSRIDPSRSKGGAHHHDSTSARRKQALCMIIFKIHDCDGITQSYIEQSPPLIFGLKILSTIHMNPGYRHIYICTLTVYIVVYLFTYL